MEKTDTVWKTWAKLLLESFLTIFVIFFRLGSKSWPDSMRIDSFQGVFATSIIELFWLQSLQNMVEGIAGISLPFNSELSLALILACTIGLNYVVLVVCRIGTSFEQTFDNISGKHRRRLYVFGCSILVATIGALWVSADFKAHSAVTRMGVQLERSSS